jgi:hypothetical protein
MWVGLVVHPLQRVVAHIFVPPDFLSRVFRIDLCNAMPTFLLDGLALANIKGMSSSSAFLFHRLHVSAACTVKYVEVRQLLEVLNVPNKLHRGAAMRASRNSGLVSVAHG